MQRCVCVCACMCAPIYLFSNIVYGCLWPFSDTVQSYTIKKNPPNLFFLIIFVSVQKHEPHSTCFFNFLLLLFSFLFFFLSLFFLKKPQLLPELHSLAVPHLYCPHAFNLLLQLQHSIQQCLGCGGTPCQIQTHIYINNNYLTHIRVCTHVTHIHTLSVSLSHMHTHTCMHTPKHTCI